jgi:hypothetical protein
MRHEEGLIHMRLGVAFANDESLRKDHFEKAISIFGEMDAVPYLRKTRELADRR